MPKTPLERDKFGADEHVCQLNYNYDDEELNSGLKYGFESEKTLDCHPR